MEVKKLDKRSKILLYALNVPTESNTLMIICMVVL